MGQNTKKGNGGELSIASQELVPCSEVKDCRALLIDKRDGETLMAIYLMMTAKWKGEGGECET